MTTYNTGNPLGSSDPRDLYDNAENLDELVNSPTKEAAPDRLGVSRKTWHGMEAEFDAGQAQRAADFDSSQSTRAAEFDAAQSDREGVFNAYLVSAGYTGTAGNGDVEDYAAGIEITQFNQVIRDASGELWRVSGSTALPYTTTGAGLPEGGAFVAVGDAVLRQELGLPVSGGNGALRVSGSVVYVDTIADLQALPTSELVDGQQASTPEGVFIWHSAREAWIPAEHSGGAMPISVQDAVWSWWAKPCLLRHVDNLVNKTYLTFSQNDGAVGLAVFDHLRRKAHRYIINRDFTPDDHNTGAVAVGDGRVAAFYPGRKHTAGPSNSLYYVEFAEGDDPRNAQWTQIGVGGNYPNAYVSNNQLLLMARVTPTAGAVQWQTRIADWPLGSFQSTQPFFSSSNSWPYFATRRSRLDSGIVNFALGWNPENAQLFNLYAGRIVREGASDPWDVESGGSVVANLTTGSGLPLNESDFELVYEAPFGERTRLFDVHDDAISFCRYPDGDSASGEYMMAVKSGGTWSVNKVCDSGLPFNGLTYYGGMSIDDDDVLSVWVSREENRKWLRERYKSADGGASWLLVESYDGANRTGSDVTSARPMAEVASQTAPVGHSYRTAFFSGRFSRTDYEDFNTDIHLPEVSTWPQANGAVLSSTGSSASGISVGVFASRDSRSAPETPGAFSAVVASDNSEANGRASLVAASENCQISQIAPYLPVNRRALSILASIGCQIHGRSQASAIIGSSGCTVEEQARGVILGSIDSTIKRGSQDLENFGAIIASLESHASARMAGVFSSAFSETDKSRGVVVASTRVKSSFSDSVVGGYATQGDASTANRTWQIRSQTGQIDIAGSIVEGVNFSDIAKLIQNGEGSEIEPGYLLTLIGEKVYKAREGERVDAIVAATPGIIQNDSPFTWHGRYLLDEWGRRQTQEVEWVAFEGYEGLASDAPDDIPEDAVYSTIEAPIENPEYDPEQENVPRSERPDEWTMAGVHGIIRTRVDASVTQAAVDAAEATRDVLFVEAGEVPGVGRLAQGETNVQVMAVEKEFDGEYGIARCLLR